MVGLVSSRVRVGLDSRAGCRTGRAHGPAHYGWRFDLGNAIELPSLFSAHPEALEGGTAPVVGQVSVTHRADGSWQLRKLVVGYFIKAVSTADPRCYALRHGPRLHLRPAGSRQAHGRDRDCAAHGLQALPQPPDDRSGRTRVRIRHRPVLATRARLARERLGRGSARRHLPRVHDGLQPPGVDATDAPALRGRRAARRGVCLVQLTCTMAALESRVTQPHRASMGKFAAVDALRENLATHDTFTPIPRRESYRIDNTDIPPDEVASMIIEQFRVARSVVAPI